MSTESFLPHDKLPDCWNDEARINVLFAPFRSRSVNPKDWDSKLLFWKNLISTYCTHNKVYVFKLSELSKKFNRKGRSPACLSIVVEELHKSGEIKPLDVFVQKSADTWPSWAMDVLVKKPFVWSFNKIKNTVITPDSDISYVHLYAVEFGSKEVIDAVPDHLNNKLIDLNEFAKLINCSKDNLKILLHYLSVREKVSIKEIKKENINITLLKFCDLKKSNPITDIDIDIYTLEESEKTLTKEINKLETDISALVAEAKSHILKGHRQTAKTYLRKKHEIEKCLDRRANALHNIQTLLSRIQDADADVHIFETYKKALSSLRTTFEENGLNDESISKTMIELEDVLEIHDDIQSSLARSNLPDDCDFEEELAELLANEDKDVGGGGNDEIVTDLGEKLKNLDLKLPSPPTTPKKEAKILM